MTRGIWIIWAIALLGAGWDVAWGASAPPEGLVAVRVRGITIDPQGASPVVLLEELQGGRIMPIWVGMFEARAIAMEMEQVVPPRPMTHDLIKNMLVGMKAQVANVVITELREQTFYAQIALAAGGVTTHIDARPSDAIAIALRVNAPIYVAKAVFDHSPGLDLGDGGPTSVTVLKRYGLTLQNITAPLATYFRLTTPEGVLVSDVEVGSGAERDGLRRGDVIVRANQTTITDVQTLDSTLTQGGDIVLQIVRQEKGLSLTLHTSAR
jgi:uncharacterized protein